MPYHFRGQVTVQLNLPTLDTGEFHPAVEFASSVQLFLWKRSSALDVFILKLKIVSTKILNTMDNKYCLMISTAYMM